MIMAEIRLNGFAAEKDIVYIIGHFNYKVFEKFLEKCENVFIHLSNCIYCHYNSDYNCYCPKSISPCLLAGDALAYGLPNGKIPAIANIYLIQHDFNEYSTLISDYFYNLYRHYDHDCWILHPVLTGAASTSYCIFSWHPFYVHLSTSLVTDGFYR